MREKSGLASKPEFWIVEESFVPSVESVELLLLLAELSVLLVMSVMLLATVVGCAGSLANI